ncbi:MAG: TRAP transporter large permease, partial [Sphaerochaetaceae bacterium]|nr:TRAP transporter large permease [Sphaerochaetaceae bacterium]
AIPGVFLGLCILLYCFLFRNYYKFPGGIRIGVGDAVRWIKFSKSVDNKWGYKRNLQSWVLFSNPLFSCELGKCIQIIMNAILPLMTIVIIMGGVGAGIFTATESAAIACFYTFILTYFIFRTARLRDFGHILKNTLKTLAVVLSLIATAKAFAYMMTDLRIPAMITKWLIAVSDNKYVLLFVINILLLILGCFMDMAPLIMIMTPILLPIVTGPLIGMNPIHFGIMLIFNLAVGLCTPPVGSALFVGCAVGKTSLEKTSKSMLGMFLVMFICLMVITYVPSFSLWLPSIVF